MTLTRRHQQPQPSPASGQEGGQEEKQGRQISQAPPARRGRVDSGETAESEARPAKRRFMGHQLLMMLCCVPMLAIVGVLILTGVLGSGAIVWALVCTAMMAAMMFMMPGAKHD